MQTREKESRDSGIIIILILLLGFICIILASGWALRFAPSWKLNTNMGSSLNPNSDFLTSRPANFIEPIDPAILTQPAWINVFLTPGILLPTRTPLPTSTVTSIPSKTSTPIVIPTQTTVPTSTLPPIIVVVPTNTKKSPPPPPTDTSVPPPPPTATTVPATAVPPPTLTPSNTPAPSADLQITKTDNASEYSAGISVKYTIVVSNAGPSNVNGAMVTDIFSTNTNIASANWTCSVTGSAACAASGIGDINDSVNLAVGSSVTYTVTANISASPAGNLVNTASVSIAGATPAGITDPVPGNNSATDTDLLASPFPPALTGPPDGVPFNMSSSSFIDLQLASSLTLGPTSYIIYYPDPVGFPPTLPMDAVILQIGDGNNWYTILNWGDGLPNTNTDTPACPTAVPAGAEPDNCLIDVSSLTNSPGITINLNGLIPAGTYPYIRIKSPGNPPDTAGDGVSIDAIVVVP